MRPYVDQNEVYQTKPVRGEVASLPVILLLARMLPSRLGSRRVRIGAQLASTSSLDGELSCRNSPH